MVVHIFQNLQINRVKDNIKVIGLLYSQLRISEKLENLYIFKKVYVTIKLFILMRIE